MGRLLYIEDDDSVREADLALFGIVFPHHEIVSATNYDEAIAAFKEKGSFDAVRTDGSYRGKYRPELGGYAATGAYDVLQYMKENNINIPTIVHTGGNPQTFVERAAAHGISISEAQVFCKPNMDPVIAFIRDALKGPGRPVPRQNPGSHHL
jgi:CheY-like chemotaxis protein